MPVNNYFRNFTSFPQQELLNDLTREVIQINGIDMLYLKKTAGYRDSILNEDPTASFTSCLQVEMYINTPEGFGGQGDVVTNYGLDVLDEVILIVNKERFTEAIVQSAPKEGDLVYLPLGKGLYEIKFVEDEKPFYALGKNHVYEITCELFRYNNELFDIPPEEMGNIFDKVERENSITRQFTMSTLKNYTKSEVIYQGATLEGATATAKIASQDGLVLQVYRVSGQFQTGVDVTGDINKEANSLVSVDDQVIKSSAFADNEEFEIEGDKILDFSEIDPWSEGDL
tara:strand:- start:1528 stop:2382 length:855 start_codon:yes stop_codon:yes gene_type:complete